MALPFTRADTRDRVVVCRRRTVEIAGADRRAAS